LKPKAPIRRRWTSNDDRVPMSDNTLNKALRIMGCDTGTGGGRCAHGFCLTASTLLNEEGAFDGDVVEAQLAPSTEAKAPAARRGGAAPAWKDGKNKSAGSTTVRTIGERVHSTQHLVGSPRQPARRGVRRLAAQIGSLACSRFDPWQRSVIFIHAVEVDHGLASHLVGLDPLVGDQLISLSLSEFAIAATVLKLDEAAPLVIIIVNHDSCICSDDLPPQLDQAPLSEMHFNGATLRRRGLIKKALRLWWLTRFC
jgi:hypothetical protein